MVSVTSIGCKYKKSIFTLLRTCIITCSIHYALESNKDFISNMMQLISWKADNSVYPWHQLQSNCNGSTMGTDHGV